jgi:hypothetical protein
VVLATPQKVKMTVVSAYIKHEGVVIKCHCDVPFLVMAWRKELRFLVHAFLPNQV